MKTIFKILIFILLFILNIHSYAQTEAGPNQEICTNQTILEADPAPNGFIGTWSVVTGSGTFSDENAENTQVNNLAENDNVLRWSITNGSDTYYDDVIITNNVSTPAITADDETICQSYYTISATIYDIYETGLWTVNSGTGTFADPTNHITDVSNISAGVNSYRWSISKGICSTYDDIEITNNEITAVVGSDETICDDFYTLTADDPSPGSGIWTVVSSGDSPVIDDSTNPVTLISGLGSGTNSIKWTVAYDGCSDYDIVIITNDKATPADAGTDKITCDSHTFLSANNPVVGSGEWSVVSSSGSIININDFYTEVTGLNIGNNEFKWTITHNLCSSEDNIIVNYDYFTADAGEDAVICGNSYSLSGNDPAPGTGIWRVTGGAGTFVNASSAQTDVNNLKTGENTFEWKITRGACVQVDYVTITTNAPSDADAGPDRETCSGETIMAAVNPDIGTGSWSIVNGSGTFSNTLQADAAVTNIGSGTNIYRWTIAYNGCSDYDDVTVINNSVFADAGPDQTTCGTSSVLNANQAQTGETAYWQLLAGTSVISDVNLHNTPVTELSSGLNQYRWTVSKGNCEDHDDIEIVNNEYLASASISDPTKLCDDLATIQGNFPPTGVTGYWTVESGTGIFDNSTEVFTVVRGISTGENIIRWSLEKDGCINYNDIIVVRNSVFADAGEDINTCGTNATIEASIIAGEDDGIWTKVSGSGIIADPTNTKTDVSGLNAGINTFRWTISGNGCEAFDEVVVTNNAFTTSAGINKQLCVNYTTLTANNPSPGYGYWEIISGGGILVTPSNYTTELTNIPNLSVNTYRWNAFINGCSAWDEMIVELNAVIADAGEDFNICTNHASLAANDPSPGSGEWSVQQGGGFIANINDPTTTVTGLSFNTNVLRWSISNINCSDYDEITITNNSVFATAGSDQELCVDYTTLTGEEPVGSENGLWELVSGSGDFQNPTLFNTQVTNLGSGYNTFRWTLFYKGCDSGGDDVTINNRGIQADAGPDQILDDFVTETNMNAGLPSGGNGEWMLLSGTGSISSIDEPSTQVSNMQTGINTFQWTVNYNGCTSYDIVNITVMNFIPYAGVDKVVCADSIRLNAKDESGTPQVWSVIEGSGDFDNINDNDTWVRNISEGINIYRWTVTLNSVTAYDEVMVTSHTAHAGEDQILCQSNVFMSAQAPSPGAEGFWLKISGPATIVTPSAYNTEITGINNLNNVFRWTIYTDYCSTYDYIILRNDQITADAGEDQIVTDSYAFLSANDPFGRLTKRWSVVSGTGTFDDNSYENTQVNGLQAGDNIFRWTITNENCSDFDDVLIFYDYEEPPVDINVLSKKIDIYPNPNSGRFNITNKYSDSYNIEIYDRYGKLLVREVNINTDTKLFDMTAYASGMYFLKLTFDQTVLSYKIVKN